MGILNKPVHVERDFGGRKLKIETGRLAKQSHGSVLISYGETVALVTAVSAYEPKPDLDFFPLTVEVQEKFYASGKIPGGFFKREARPTEWAILNCRLVDRPIRPLFPAGYRFETQLAITILSYDNDNELEAIAGLGASAALLISDIPFETPIGTVRVGRVDGTFVVNPTPAQQEHSDVNVIVSATKNAVTMVEGEAENVAEDIFLDGVFFGFEKIQEIIAMQEELRKLAGKEKRAFVPAVKDEALEAKVAELSHAQLKEAYALTDKKLRYEKISEIKKATLSALLESVEQDQKAKAEKTIKGLFDGVKKNVARGVTLESGKRIDGRDYDQIRPIECEVGVLPRTHGSSLFTRGETQALATITLGTSDDEQLIDSVRGKYNKRYMLHYNFPPYCVGETGRFGGTARREVGHGFLAEKAVDYIIPKHADFPYTIRIVSEVLESNGSSSMATVCGASMALMNAGVPVKTPVSGIAMGLMKEGDKVVVLSDILGDEDHLGDMDFKVCGTDTGVTAVQMDIKIDGVSREIMKQALEQARAGRAHILGEMAKAIKETSKEMSAYAPRMTTVQISTERIKDLIGPGGKNIKNIIATTGVKVEVDDTGRVNVASSDPLATQKAIEMINALTAEPEIGRVYMGKVVRIADFGCFVEFMPGYDGLCHISELAHERVAAVRDVVEEGDVVPVKVLEVDRQGKVRLSRKAALPV
jgi:polyribonucleotide nucleotidyltransferase